MKKVAVVIPCYNEEKRLNFWHCEQLLTHSAIDIIFVNDGSKDRTPILLQEFVSQHAERTHFVNLEVNQGKGEAVRHGLLKGIELGFEQIGYIDADFSTPENEVRRLIQILLGSQQKVVMGARVRLLGTQIDRKITRQYLGRIFSTVASIMLGLRVYDTQCGAKFFRSTESLAKCLLKPFKTKWVFDVELISRLMASGTENYIYTSEDFLEVPLKAWRDVDGSKLTSGAMLKSGFELFWIGFKRRFSPDFFKYDALEVPPKLLTGLSPKK